MAIMLPANLASGAAHRCHCLPLCRKQATTRTSCQSSVSRRSQYQFQICTQSLRCAAHKKLLLRQATKGCIKLSPIRTRFEWVRGVVNGEWWVSAYLVCRVRLFRIIVFLALATLYCYCCCCVIVHSISGRSVGHAPNVWPSSSANTKWHCVLSKQNMGKCKQKQ